MSWLDSLLGTEEESGGNGGNGGNGTNLQDKDIALDMLITSKSDIGMLTKAITETTNPQLRQMLTNQLNTCINDHFRLSDMAINKGWYNAYANPQQQVQQDVIEAQNLNSQQ